MPPIAPYMPGTFVDFEGAILRHDRGDDWRPTGFAIDAGATDVLRRHCLISGIRMLDAIGRQLEELAATRFPGAPQREEARAFVEQSIAAAGDAGAVGVWWYYPWLQTVVHLLAEDDFRAVITNRNQDKLTAEELQLLRTKRIGAIGLSVGGEAAVTVAQEHLCGEIWLADFDGLDLSNLNRLGAGVDELGDNKAVIVARRIARLDPYIRVQIFPEGVNESSVEAFVGDVDLVLEECDSLPIKGLVREAARRLGINVLYAADERGFVSVEPYANEPSLTPFLGDVPDAHRSRADFSSSQEFYRALTAWLGGWDAISLRSQESLAAIGSRLCGYPQLASEARFAAGVVGHIARRLLLGERVSPFQGHLDLDRFIANVPGR